MIRDCISFCERDSGGYCGGVPPLPIPNREVKPACADGTAMQCGRVGSCLLLSRSSESNDFGDLFFVPVSEKNNGKHLTSLAPDCTFAIAFGSLYESDASGL